MKGITGLVSAVVLGVLAVGLNWFYLDRKSREFQREYFVGVAHDHPIQPGELFRSEDLEPIPVPTSAAARLKYVAVLWADRGTVVGSNAVKSYQGDELILLEDLKTPPPELTLEENERAVWIPVDQKTFVPSLVVPGDKVDFIVSRPRAAPLHSGGDAPAPTPATPPDGPKPIGPFEILSIGNRLGKSNILNAAQVPQMQENVITIRVRMDGTVLEEKARELLDGLQATNYREVMVMLRPRTP
jgi:hypothetical protein